MFLLVPINTSSIYNKWPFANWFIIAVTIAVSAVVFWTLLETNALPDWFDSMVLDGWEAEGLIGHMLLHGGTVHLAGNMLFLWVFGNTVCSKIGSIWYLLIYLCCGVGAAAAHNVITGGPVIGASGAVYGIIGFYLILQPINNVEMFYWIFFRIGKFVISGFWIILLWVLLDLWGLHTDTQGEANIAYASHVGGFITGIILGFLLVYFKVVSLSEYDNPTLPEYLKIVPMGHCGGYHVFKEQRDIVI